MHSQYNIFDRTLDYEKILSDNVRLSLDRIHQLKEADLDNLIYVDIFTHA